MPTLLSRFSAATVAYFVSGFILFAALPGMKTEFLRYPGVYRTDDGMRKLMPYNLIGILVSVAVVAVLYAKIYPAGGGMVAGVCLGRAHGDFRGLHLRHSQLCVSEHRREARGV